MSVRSAQSVTALFTTRVWATGVGTDADSLPAGTLYLNGAANAATVTVTKISTGLYKAAVTLPTLAVGDEVEISIAATVSSVTDTAVIWGDTKDFFAGSIPDVAFASAGGLGDVQRIGGTSQTGRDIGASVLLAVGTGTGQVNLASGKVPATLAATDVAGNVAADLQTIKTQTITCAAGVTVLASVGTATASTAQSADNNTKLADIQTRLPAALVSGRMDSSVGAMAANVITASAINAAALNGKGDWMVTYAQPTGFLAATFPSGTIANTTNITAGTIATVTNLTNAPTVGDFTSTMKTSLNAATPVATVSGDLSATMKTSVQTAADAAVTANTLVNAIAGYIDTEVAAIKSKTDNLPPSPASETTLAALVTTVGVAGLGLYAIPKTGFKLASDGLALIIPADPSTKPTPGVSSIVVWIGWFGAWSLNPVNDDGSNVHLKDSANSGNLATHAVSDNGTTFVSGAAT